MSELIDNRARRIRTLADIISRLHAGADPNSVRAELAHLVREADAGEIAAMEQELIARGTPVEHIQGMCDLHAAVVRDILAAPQTGGVAPGHPVDTFRQENIAIRAHIAAMRELIEAVRAQPADADVAAEHMRWRHLVGELMDVDKHYQRKENLLFSCLERHGITGPSKVMWAVDDEARAHLRKLDAALAAAPSTVAALTTVADQVAPTALLLIQSMTDKEENILLPMALQTLTEDEWGEIWRQSPEYGWCLVEPRTGYTPPGATEPAATAEVPAGKALRFPTGALDIEQLLGIFSTLPVDLTFVDAEDRVRFFSEGPDRVFARSKAVLGRLVQHCHPPKSVHIVDQILSDFRAGRQRVAEFWIELRGRFVHIRYFAVRSPAGQYLGTLEVTQDLTPLRALTGERRLLQYDTPAA
jgi:DUF438 domain-containing protein